MGSSLLPKTRGFVLSQEQNKHSVVGNVQLHDLKSASLIGGERSRLVRGDRMCIVRWSAYLVLFLACSLASGYVGSASIPSAQAQIVPQSLAQGGTEAVMRNRKNNWTLGIVGGQLSGTYMTLANELAEVLDDGDNLRIIPIVTYGAASNMDDLLYLQQVDLAVTQSDVFDYFRTQRKISNLENRVNYIIRLPVSELHILAAPGISSIEDLKGKKVSFGPAGSASSLTGTIVFQRLGVQVEQVLFDNPTALQKLKS